MLEPHTSLFLLPQGTSAERRLHPGRVVHVVDDLCTVQLNGSVSRFRADQELLVYRVIRRTYMRQSARVRAVLPGAHRISLETTGAPVSAENRDCYRVSTAAADVQATFGTEPGCRVLDLSATGFSLLASAVHPVDSQLDVVLHHAGAEHAGRVAVQSARRWAPRRTRYGVYCLEDRGPGASLRAALPRLNLDLQREFLQRLSGIR